MVICLMIKDRYKNLGSDPRSMELINGWIKAELLLWISM